MNRGAAKHSKTIERTDVERAKSMNGDANLEAVRSIQGQILRRTDRREVAIFLCGGALWVADFVDGHGELIDAVTWFRFHCADTAVTHAERRMLHESATPLSPELSARIESLLRSGSPMPGAPALGAAALTDSDERSSDEQG